MSDENFIYKPEVYEGPKDQNATLGVKFSNDIFLMKSFLDQRNIEYKIEDLEDGPMGLGLRIKRENK